MYQIHPRIGWVDPGLYIYNFFSLAKNMALSGSTPVGVDLTISRGCRLSCRVMPFTMCSNRFGHRLHRLRFLRSGACGPLLCRAHARQLRQQSPGAHLGRRAASALDCHRSPKAISMARRWRSPCSPSALWLADSLVLLGVPRAFWAGAVSRARSLDANVRRGSRAPVCCCFFRSAQPPAGGTPCGSSSGRRCGGICVIVGLGALVCGTECRFCICSGDRLAAARSGGGLHDYIVAPARWLPAATPSGTLADCFRAAGWRRTTPLADATIWRRALLVAISGWTVLFMAGDIVTDHFFTQFRFYARLSLPRPRATSRNSDPGCGG